MWRRGRQSHRAVTVLSLVLVILSCTRWQSQPVTPIQVGEPGWDHIRVTLSTGAQLEFWNPVVSRDSLYGNLKPVPAGDMRWLRAVKLTEIGDVEVRRADTGKTLLLVGGVVAVLAVAAAIAIAETMGELLW